MKILLTNRKSIITSIINFQKDCFAFTEQLANDYPKLNIFSLGGIERGALNMTLEQKLKICYFAITLCENKGGLSERSIELHVRLSGKIEISEIWILKNLREVSMMDNMEQDFKLKKVEKVFDDENKLKCFSFSQTQFEKLMPELARFLETGKI